jgi:hypothetical protein
LKLELDDREGRAVGRSLAERKARLIEKVEDTTQLRTARRSGLIELKAIESVLRKLRISRTGQARWTGDSSRLMARK